ncbi:MAG TPA: ATP-binding protein, partial [Gammaproteobacteria bacterium]|nr:ATP-binding protein [Gammaproteobacteria bacterium]
VLVVGRGDRIDDHQLFAREDASLGLYRRSPGARRLARATPPFGAFVPEGAFAREAAGIRAGASRAAARSRGEHVKLATLHEHVVERYLPPSVVVNADNDVVHYSQRASAYVRFPGGEPTHNVLKLVREPLRSPLRRALVQVRRAGTAWHSPPLDVRSDHGLRRIVLHVEPLAEDESGGLLVVIFDERLGRQRDSLTPAHEIIAIDAIARLEDELERANARIRSLLAGTDNGQYDLPLSNESLQRANDELRFILEELEGSREELQAANEELITLDAENRRKIEELAELSGDLKHLLESTGVATLLLDRELRIVRFTPQLSELFNVTLLDRGRPLSDLTHGLDYGGLEADLERVLQDLAPLDHEVEGRNGRWYLTRMLPYRTAAGGVDGVVLTLIDITDRKHVEEKLRDADRRKDEFLALLAHELRNPLAPITTGIEILSRVGSDPRMVGQITATMARQSRTLVRLVDDLLDVSRITGGRLRLSKAPTSIGDVVRDAVAAVRSIIERAGHELIVSVPDEDIVVNADATRLAQVLGNLLNNAARYTPKHGRIELRAARERGEAVVTVADNGVGMSEDIRARVFDMFFQGNDPRLVRNAGLGIGLTLARSLVEMHGGSISVESPGPDCGSVFTVRLPVAVAGDLPAAASAPADAEAVGGHRVLIVDDNADAAETLRMLVSTFGDNDVRTAFSGPDALAKSVDMHPDIVLLDLKMPGMDGFEVARRLRAQPGGGDMTIVAVTGWGQDEHKRRTREAGFDSHLTKPADRAELEAVLAGTLGTKEPPASYAS